MHNYFSLYCKIFIDTDLDRESVLNSIINITSSKNNTKWRVNTENLEIELRKNEDFSEYKRNEEDDGFLYFRYYLDIDPNKDTKQSDYIIEISSLLEGLWTLNYRAIAACDFEEELPRKGGRFKNTF